MKKTKKLKSIGKSIKNQHKYNKKFSKKFKGQIKSKRIMTLHNVRKIRDFVKQTNR